MSDTPETDTPETDAMVTGQFCAALAKPLIDHARRLERERNYLRRRCAVLGQVEALLIKAAAERAGP